ncbi:MAG: Crp/Fnr family transcriptional regulator [Candidatus Saccharimonadales bacterium]
MLEQSQPQLIASFFQTGTRTQFDKEEIIYDSKKNGSPVFMLESGYVKSYAITSEGNYNVLCIYGPGSIFPLAPTLRANLGRSPYHLREMVYFEAIVAVEVYVQSADKLMKYLERHPEGYRELVVSLINNYELYLSRVEASPLKHARQRLAYHLLVLAERFSSELYDQIIIELPLTHQDLADSLGMARETISRELEWLRREDIVNAKDKHLIIKDQAQLRRIINPKPELRDS